MLILRSALSNDFRGRGTHHGTLSTGNQKNLSRERSVRGGYFLSTVTPGQSSVRKGEAGSPSLL
jgi:hypothetical protein